MRGPTAWREVTQDDVDVFAGLSRDRQWIHTDVERAARESPYGGTIAHGTLTLAMIDGWRDELLGAEGLGRWGVNVGYDRVRFPAPVRVGTRVRARITSEERTPLDDGSIRVVHRFEVEAEDEDRPVCVADSVIRVHPSA